MRKSGSPLLAVLCALSGLSCSLVVDTDLPPLGSDVGGDETCSADADCQTLLGNRYRCVRGQCFDLDAPCAQTERVTGNIETDTTWYPDTCYELASTVFVRSGATLTIEPGTLVTGLADEAALIVTRNGRLLASGTIEDPIVMTSGRPEGTRRPGDWGGLAVLGRAPLTVGEDFLEGLPESEDTRYGDSASPDPEWNCGAVRYTRIEFAGFEFANNNELNGLTLGGCGFDTRVEYVQVHYGSDDGIEVFGGDVGLQWVVISRAQDDSLDWDQGWRGWAQFVAILQDAPRPDLDPNLYTGGDNGIEADGIIEERMMMQEVVPPRSRPRLYNFTMVGSRGQDSSNRGMILREGTSAVMRNFLVIGYPRGLWDVRDPVTADCMMTPLGPSCAPGDAFVLDGLLLHDMGPDGNTPVVPDAEDNDGGFDEATYIAEATDRRVLVLDRNTQNPNLIQPDLDGFGPVDLRPIASSIADLRTQSPPPFADPPEQVQPSGQSYLGAFEPGGLDWTVGWTAYPDN